MLRVGVGDSRLGTAPESADSGHPKHQTDTMWKSLNSKYDLTSYKEFISSANVLLKAVE